MGRAALVSGALATLASTCVPTLEAAPSPVRFREVAPQGFGDRHNTKAWAMAWWRGKLYVGTARAHICLAYAARAATLRGLLPYPPHHSELRCPPDMHDLPLRSEIWELDPRDESWRRVFVSPEIPNPAAQGKLTARDAGIRNLLAFVDPDGTESLYAVGITSDAINTGMPPPRILRTTDGENWLPVPQDEETVLGDLSRGQASFRAAEVYKGRFFVVNGGLLGAGTVLEADEPSAGGNSFRRVTPPKTAVFEMVAYNDHLYLGVVSADGYRIVKTDAEGEPPYELASVVEKGGYLRRGRSRGPVSMYVYGQRLYVGTDSPTDLIRINPDDSWDLVVGRPRSTPDGRKEPLSGLGTGFDYRLSNHFHRMVEHEGSLYVSVNDGAGFFDSARFDPTSPRIAPYLDSMGFDLFRSSDGVEFSLVTLTGLGSPRDNTIRVFASTPHGLFAGSANPFDGLRIYRGEAPPSHDAPRHLDAERTRGGFLLSWEPVAGTALYRIFRRTLGEGPTFVEVATIVEPFFVDATVPRRGSFHYYVIAENAEGERSPPSNLARAPSLRRPATLSLIGETTKSWADRSWLRGVTPSLLTAHGHLRAGNTDAAISSLKALKTRIGRGVGSPSWREQELELVLSRLIRRARLAQRGLLPTAQLR